MTAPRIYSGTGTSTFFRDHFFRYRYRYFFSGPIFSSTGTGTFCREQFFPVPVPVSSKKRENSRDRDKTGTIWDFFQRLTQCLQHLIPFRAEVDILEDTDFFISWALMSKASSFSPTSGQCRLCLMEKSHIINFFDMMLIGNPLIFEKFLR